LLPVAVPLWFFFGSGEISSDIYLFWFCPVRIAESEGKLGRAFVCSYLCLSS